MSNSNQSFAQTLNPYGSIRFATDLPRVIECMKRYPATKAHYYALREVEPSSLSEVEIAARFLFLNKLCFNGIYRTNLAGRFNVPYAKPKRRRVVFDFDTLNKTAALLKNASLLHGDFEIVLAEARANDFVYLDPPYAVAKRRVFSEYQAQGFSDRDLDRLRSCLVELDRRDVVPLDDGHLLCIEVSENIYSNTLDSVVLRCRDKGLPVKLVVAAPKNLKDVDYSKKIKDAKIAGVGVLEVDAASGSFVQMPLSLSLAGVRPLHLADFPPRYRQPLQHAQQMFRDGEPSKACSLVYDELEGLCRSFAKKSAQKKLWTPGKLKLDSSPWASVMTSIDKTLDRSNPLAKKISTSLVARVIGITGHRNESGHKPKSLKDRIKRDQALRTRFEGSVDLLREFLEASKGFRL